MAMAKSERTAVWSAVPLASSAAAAKCSVEIGGMFGWCW